MWEVIIKKKKVLLREDITVDLYGDRIELGGEEKLVFPFDEITAVSVLGRNKLNIYHDKKVYQLKGNKRFNALKYVNIYHRHKNIVGGKTNDKFLGL